MSAIDLFPNSPLNQVRLNIGDFDGEYINDDVLNYILEQNSNDVSKSSISASEYILKNLAKLRDESVGPVSIRWSQVYKNYKELYREMLLKLAPTNGSEGGGLFFFGGTLKSENESFYSNTNVVGSPVKEGFASSFGEVLPSRSNPYSLEK